MGCWRCDSLRVICPSGSMQGLLEVRQLEGYMPLGYKKGLAGGRRGGVPAARRAGGAAGLLEVQQLEVHMDLGFKEGLAGGRRGGAFRCTAAARRRRGCWRCGSFWVMWTLGLWKGLLEDAVLERPLHRRRRTGCWRCKSF